MTTLSGHLAGLTAPLVFRRPAHLAKKLHAFARAERGSFIDLAQAATLTPDADRAAAYLRHAADEARHARLFEEHAQRIGREVGLRLGAARADSERLFATLGEVGFLAFVHLGERRGCDQFRAWARYFHRAGHGELGRLLEGILVDEERHERYTFALLTDLVGTERLAHRAVARARRWEAWRRWRRAGRSLSLGLYTALMGALYLGLFPLAGWVKLRHRVPEGFVPAERALPHGDR